MQPIETKEEDEKGDKYWWRPVMIFYAKTTSWIIIPLVLAVFLGKYITKSTGSQYLFFVCIMFGFGITCIGIWREIKEYKKDLEAKSDEVGSPDTSKEVFREKTKDGK